MDRAPQLSTFRMWVAMGTKFASLAGAGEDSSFNTFLSIFNVIFNRLSLFSDDYRVEEQTTAFWKVTVRSNFHHK
jgi:hypothetical protein